MKKVNAGLTIFIFLGIVLIVMAQLASQKREKPITNQIEVVKKIDIDSKLPYTHRLEESGLKLETIAYRLWLDFMGTLESDGLIEDARFERFTILSGDENSFVAAVVFEVHLPEGTPKIDNGWGEVQEDRVVPNIVWKLTINKAESLTYALTNIESTTDTLIGLPPVELLEEYQNTVGIEKSFEGIKYEIKGETLRVTYDDGENWVAIPASLTDIFGIGYNGSQQKLIEGSFVITPKTTAFVLEHNTMVNMSYNTKLSVLISTDKGKYWKEVLVSDSVPVLRMKILGFTSNEDGYLIVTGDKTMNSEANFVFKTNDGGQSWYNAGSVGDVYSLVTDGGFINDQLGFISFGEYRYESQPPIPRLYRTVDGGVNWEHVEVTIPEEYLGYFTIAEIPTFNGTEGTLFVNQGPMGDYLGGKVLAKFTSKDQGKTWSFAGFVDPDGALR